ncbi:MAG: hypothetical protein HZC01_01610 [Candidatus Kerfeldbacteria bacterium]|nr:hypothetical protein [Candidatus Kerfeldbacteria bacterium]
MSPLRNSFSYRAILKRAYELTKKNKILWFFGFFAAFLGVGGELESLFQNYSSVTGTSKTILSIQTFYQDGIFGTIFGNIREFFGAYPAQGFLFLLLLFVVTILILWLSIVSQIALFDSAKKLNANKKVVYQEAYQVGNRHFGSVLGVTLLLRGLWYALLAVLGSVLVSWFLERESLAGGIAFIFFIFLILIPISVIVSFMLRYAVAYIVLKEKSAIEAVRLGWQLFKANWIISVEMALLIVVLGLVAGLVIAIGIGLASVPFILIGIAATFFGSASGFAVAVVAMTIVWFLVAALVGSMYVAFQYSAWTLLFTELDKSRAESKVVRLLNRLGIRTA